LGAALWIGWVGRAPGNDPDHLPQPTCSTSPLPQSRVRTAWMIYGAGCDGTHRYPEVNLNNKLYRGIREAKALLDGTIGAQFEDSLQPLPSEPVVVKKRVSAHYGTELPLLLQTMRASEVVRAPVCPAPLRERERVEG
jgi:nicotinamidase-related amidase